MECSLNVLITNKNVFVLKKKLGGKVNDWFNAHLRFHLSRLRPKPLFEVPCTPVIVYSETRGPAQVSYKPERRALISGRAFSSSTFTQPGKINSIKGLNSLRQTSLFKHLFSV